MDENKEWLTERIKKDWSSRDGFFSFMDNTYEGWYEELQSDDADERYIGVMIGYIMYCANEDIYDDLITDTLENFYISEYIFNTKENK